VKQTILIADDDKKSIKLLRDVLQASGYFVAVARDGRETVALAQARKPDLILMDIRMPVMDGIAAMKKLRANPNTDRIPIIAITAHAMRGDKERFIQQGFDDFLAKPVDIHVLLDRVRLHLHEEE
jgi:two-component system cell cycle response regulator DivK